MRTNGTLRRRRLGRELRQLREDAGLTLEEAAPRLDWSTSKLGRIETGRQALRLIAIVDESALRRPVGGVKIMRAQLRQVVARAALPSVCLQVLPFSLGAHSGMDGSFIVLGFDEPDEPEIAYLEHTAGALHLERKLRYRLVNWPSTSCGPRR